MELEEIENKTLLRDLLQKWNLKKSKTTQICETYLDLKDIRWNVMLLGGMISSDCFFEVLFLWGIDSLNFFELLFELFWTMDLKNVCLWLIVSLNDCFSERLIFWTMFFFWVVVYLIYFVLNTGFFEPVFLLGIGSPSHSLPQWFLMWWFVVVLNLHKPEICLSFLW